jgi:ubiquinone/menaquinone biosynthesis C-methylase UbiE
MFTASERLYSQTTPLIDAEDPREVARWRLLLDLFAPILERSLPEEEQVSSPRHVLDLACGQGLFALDLADASPYMQVVGVDLSAVLIDLAQRSAREQELANASFHIVDLTRLPFPFCDGAFDFINAAFLQTFLEEAQWLPLLTECARLLKPCGILRLVECDYGLTTSEAIERLSRCYGQAVQKAGLCPTPVRLGPKSGRSDWQVRLLTEAGFEVWAPQRITLDFSIQQVEAYVTMRQVISFFFELIEPLVLRMEVLSQEAFVRLVEQAGHEIRRLDFCGRWHLSIMWGRKGEGAGQAKAARGDV